MQHIEDIFEISYERSESMRKIKIIRGFGIAFVAGLHLMLKLSAIQSLNILMMI